MSNVKQVSMAEHTNLIKGYSTSVPAIIEIFKKDSNKTVQILSSRVIVNAVWHAFSLLLPYCRHKTISANGTDFNGSYFLNKMFTINDEDLRLFLSLFFQGKLWNKGHEIRTDKVVRILGGRSSFLGINPNTLEELLHMSRYNHSPFDNLECKLELDELIHIFRWAMNNIPHNELKACLDEQHEQLYGYKITENFQHSRRIVVSATINESSCSFNVKVLLNQVLLNQVLLNQVLLNQVYLDIAETDDKWRVAEEYDLRYNPEIREELFVFNVQVQLDIAETDDDWRVAEEYAFLYNPETVINVQS